MGIESVSAPAICRYQTGWWQRSASRAARQHIEKRTAFAHLAAAAPRLTLRAYAPLCMARSALRRAYRLAQHLHGSQHQQ